MLYLLVVFSLGVSHAEDPKQSKADVYIQHLEQRVKQLETDQHLYELNKQHLEQVTRDCMQDLYGLNSTLGLAGCIETMK